MNDKKFVPRSDIDKMSELEQRQYYLDACEYFQVPPELNVLYFTYFDSGDGARVKVLAAKKGATDIIRDRLHINITELTDKMVNGSIVFFAKGMNGKGRFEMATGAKYIEGLKGQDLDSAIMTAQTRALKRLTLQFAGGGLLDESEVPNSVTADIAKASRPAEQPKSKPNMKVESPIDVEALKTMGKTQPLDITPAQEAARAVLAHVKPEVLAKAAGDPMTDAIAKAAFSLDPPFVAQNPPNQGVSSQEIAPKRRTRQKPVDMDIPFSLDGSVSAPVEKPKLAEPLPVPPMPKLETLEERKVEKPAVLAAPYEAKNAVPISYETLATVIPNVPAEVQMKAYRDRLFTYTNTILPKAGMVPTENVGGPAMKVRLFAQSKFNAVLNQLSVEQWEEMFKLFESKSPAELVKLIDDAAIGSMKK